MRYYHLEIDNVLQMKPWCRCRLYVTLGDRQPSEVHTSEDRQMKKAFTHAAASAGGMVPGGGFIARKATEMFFDVFISRTHSLPRRQNTQELADALKNTPGVQGSAPAEAGRRTVTEQ